MSINGSSIADIAGGLGITKQAVAQRIKPLNAVIELVKHSRKLAKDEETLSKVVNFVEENIGTGNLSMLDFRSFGESASAIFIDQYFPNPTEDDSLWIEQGLALPRLMQLRGIKIKEAAYEGAKWSELKTVALMKLLAEQLGTPTLMPKQKQQTASLRGAVQRFGGQSEIAQKAGLVYQGQAVGTDGRTFWSDDAIVNAIKTVAKSVGRPELMPSQEEVKKHFPDQPSIVANLQGSQRKHGETRSWPQLATLCGLIIGKQTQTRKGLQFLQSFVRSLGDHINSMDASEIYVLFQQQGLEKRSGRTETFNKIMDALQSGFLPTESVQRWAEGEQIQAVEELLSSDLRSPVPSARSVQLHTFLSDSAELDPVESLKTLEADDLPTIKTRAVLESLDANTNILLASDSDEEAVEFFVAKAKRKLWEIAFERGDQVLEELDLKAGNTVTTEVANSFRSEYLAARDLSLPTGYSFTDLQGRARQPKIMQKLIAVRVLNEQRVLNLSGTGTGKTLSAILASRVINASMTVIVCPNSTVDNWSKNILDTFSDSSVLTKEWPTSWLDDFKHKYLVINHEMLNNSNEADIKRFIETWPIDLVVIDEIHKAKQRSSEVESQRRRLLNGLITDLPEGRQPPRVLGLSATPVINNLFEGRSLVELVTSEIHEEIGTDVSVQNCMRLYQKFCTLGFRQRSEQLAKQLTIYHDVDCSDLLPDILNLGGRPHPQAIEALLLPTKMAKILENITRKTVIFTDYVSGIVAPIQEAVSRLGFSVATHTGSDKNPTEYKFSDSLDQFLHGELDVLIASTSTLATGVDGLQSVCNNVIFATLPWTNTDLEQAIGRFDRQGFIFDELYIHIPRTFGIHNGTEWSYCDMKLARLESKKDMATASVDGLIPDEKNMLSANKATEYWRNWVARLENGDVQESDRQAFSVPLSGTPKEKAKRLAQYGMFSQMNSRWNIAYSHNTNQRLNNDPEEWFQYHSLYRESRENWPIIPFEEVASWLEQRSGWKVADLGCGEALLQARLDRVHEVYSFDHVAINDSVTACDMQDLPLESESMDVVVFSLSLMGRNIEDYLNEAFRVLKPFAVMHIVESTSRFDNLEKFAADLATFGFDIVDNSSKWKFTHLIAMKNSAKLQEPRSINFTSHSNSP